MLFGSQFPIEFIIVLNPLLNLSHTHSVGNCVAQMRIDGFNCAAQISIEGGNINHMTFKYMSNHATQQKKHRNGTKHGNTHTQTKNTETHAPQWHSNSKWTAILIENQLID